MPSALSWNPCRAGPRRRSGWWCGRAPCCWQLTAWRTARSRSGWTSARTRPASGGDEYVLSADEKPGVQARMRIHLPLPPGPGRSMRAESEYHRFGTLAYLAAYDVHRAQVMGRCEATTGIRPLTALVDQVMQAEPYASARRVFWVVDNGASHRNWAAAARLSDA